MSFITTYNYIGQALSCYQFNYKTYYREHYGKNQYCNESSVVLSFVKGSTQNKPIYLNH
jgi:hypothetical protein